MKINRDVIRWLTIIIVLLMIIEVFFFPLIKNTLFESIIFNLITGCIVSVIMAYINYKNEIGRINGKFIEKVTCYYLGLQNVLFYCKNIDNKNPEELYNLLEKNINQLIKENRIEYNIDNYFFIFKTSRLRKLDINYRIIKGILSSHEYLIILFETQMNICNKKESVKKLYSLAKKDNNQIDTLMNDIKACNINRIWNDYKKNFKDLIVK